MYRWNHLTMALMLVLLLPLPAAAGDFDGSKPLLCAFMDIIECSDGGECMEVTPESINAPRFIEIDFKRKKISGTRAGGEKATTEIKNTERIDGKLILQGMENGQENVRDGLGWSLAIQEDTGKMVLTGSGDGAGFVVFGACTPS